MEEPLAGLLASQIYAGFLGIKGPDDLAGAKAHAAQTQRRALL